MIADPNAPVYVVACTALHQGPKATGILFFEELGKLVLNGFVGIQGRRIGH